MNNDELKNKIDNIDNMSADALKAEIFRLALELDLRKEIAESEEKIHKYEKRILEIQKQYLEDELDYYYECQENGWSFKVRPVSRILRTEEESQDE